jgi:hypothetical protein
MDLKANYDRELFINFFTDEFLPEDYIRNEERIDLDFQSKYFKNVYFLGGCQSLDLNVYEVIHSSENDARVTLSRDAFKLVSRYEQNNALVLFVPENANNFRLSLVTIEPKLDNEGIKVKREYSNPKRYSYILGVDSKTHTPEQYLIKKGRIANLVDLKSRFSVEVVNKDFYNLVAEMFSKLVGGRRKKGNRNIDYNRQLYLPSVSSENDKKYKEFAVRLIGRIMFCWFLTKKKSESNLPLIPEEVLSKDAVDVNPGFYHSRVEPLFFEVLNTPIEKRKPRFRVKPFDSIPFLNGGLFEPHPDDYYEIKSQAETSTYVNTLKIPDDWWKEFLGFLEIYNFTIDENTSIDIDLSVDPEMLGRIFENLLAEINPETGKTARKSTGSYYTPRPVVEYMVDSSLKHYFEAKTKIESKKISYLLNNSVEDSGLTPNEEQEVESALFNLKILDPACGSGAFPMGILQKILMILQKVDHNAEKSVEQVLKTIKDPIKRDLIKRKLEIAHLIDDRDFNDYARKLNLIQRSIYGIDIQPIAVEISKLRFFLSIIVDEVIQDDTPNRGIESLPNLEFKFVCANSLIPLPKENNWEKLFGDAKIIQSLESLREKYFTATNEEKPNIRQEFRLLQDQIKEFIFKNRAVLQELNSRFGLLSEWKPFSDEATGWFDSKWMFGIQSGFDIIIGNPPYLREKDNARIFKPINNSELGQKYHQGKMDYWFYFLHRAMDLLGSESNIAYITSRYWLNSKGAKKLINRIKENLSFYRVVDIGKLKVFDNVAGQHMVAIYSNRKYNGFDYKRLSGDINRIVDEEPNEYVSIDYLSNAAVFKVNDEIIFDQDDVVIPTKVEPLGKIYDSSIGIQESPDKLTVKHLENTEREDLHIGQGVFVLSETELHKLNLNSVELSIVKPYLDPNDVFAYKIVPQTEKYIIYSDKKVTGLIAKSPEYNRIKKHLDNFSEFISSSNAPYGLHRPRKLKYFLLPKIVFKGMFSNPEFAYDSEGYFIGFSFTSIIQKNKDYSLKYLLAILNSSFAKYWFYKNGKHRGGGVDIGAEKLRLFPIPHANAYIQDMFEEKIEEIIQLVNKNGHKNEEYLELQKTMNIRVLKLYAISFKDAKYIDSEIEGIITEDQYNSFRIID